MKAARDYHGRLRLVTAEPATVSAETEPSVHAEEVLSSDSTESESRTSDEMSALSDAQLVALASNRDRRALEVLYRRHASFAIRLATRIEGSERDVEDIVHDSFLRAFERIRDLAEPSSFRSWLGAIVVHQVRSRMRRVRLMGVLGLWRAGEPVDLDAVASVEASPLVRAQVAQVYALLQTLSVDERIAWTLRSIEGHDLETVANLTRCSLATVKRRISRAQRFLDDHFVDPHHREEAGR